MNKQHELYREDILQILSTKGLNQLFGKTILVTGATGMLGMHLIDAFMAIGDINVIAVGRSRKNAEKRLGEYFSSDKFLFIEQDVCSPLPKHLKVDYIIPLASNTHPLAYSQYPFETLMTNILGTKYALEKSIECDATLLYPSTVEIYGNARDEDVFDEDYTGNLNLSNSRACYPESKRVCEAMCQSYISEYGAKVKIVRLSRIFGPTMLLSDSKASSQFILKSMYNEDIVLKSNGQQFFSYTYVTDAVCAILFVLLYGVVGLPYNISNERCNIRLKDFAAICAGACGCEVVFELPSNAELQGYSIAQHAILDNTRICNLGWKPKYEMSEAICRTIKILQSDYLR